MEFKDSALDLFMRTVEVNTASGQEKAMAEFIIGVVEGIGIPVGEITFDLAHFQFPKHGLAGDCPNLFITIPATPGLEGKPCIGFNAHMDRVKPSMGVKPILTDDGLRVVSDGTTVLGADDGAGIAVILQMLRTLHELQIPHGPLQLVFTVSEETRLLGSRFIDPSLITARMVYSFDGDKPQQLFVATCASDKYSITVRGKNAHAGVHPEQGLSAPLAMSHALVALRENGLFGRIEREGRHVASTNFVIEGFQPVGTNSVQAELKIGGEGRSLDEHLLPALTDGVRNCFLNTMHDLSASCGVTGEIVFEADRAYNCLNVDPDSEVVQRAVKAIANCGLEAEVMAPVMGGLDACWLNQYVPTIALGMGAYRYHTVEEYLDIEEFLQANRIAVALAVL